MDEHHKWQVITWAWLSSLDFHSNFGQSPGILVGNGGQYDQWSIGSFVSLDTYSNSTVATNDNCGFKGMGTFYKTQFVDSNLVGMDFNPKVADFEHKQFDISPTKKYSNHTKMDSVPTKVVFD